VDIGWGSSNTAIILSRYISGKVQIIYSKEFTRPLFQDIINEIWRLYHKCNGREYLQNILIDASATELYTALCNEYDQNCSQKYLAEEQKTVDQWNNYASSMNALNKRMGGTKNILELKRNPYV
jgi:hypothetical protein